MIIQSEKELNTLRECGHRLARILNEVVKAVRPGIATKELDRLAESLILSHGGEPVFKGYKIYGVKRPYPGSLCVSINDEIVHGIPSDRRIIRDGDVVGLDIGMRYPAARQPITNNKQPTTKNKLSVGDESLGLITDMAATIGVGKISNEAEKLLRATKESLDSAISILKPGLRLGDLGSAIQRHLEKNGLGVIRDLAGHGVGKELHENPMVLNYGKRGGGAELVEGQIIAIEPMAALGDWKIKTDDDEWTIRTADGSLAAHFEHTVVMMRNGAEVLTKYSS